MDLEESYFYKFYYIGMFVVGLLVVVFIWIFYLNVGKCEMKKLFGFWLWFVVGNFLNLFLLLYRFFCDFVIKYGGFMYLCLGMLDF